MLDGLDKDFFNGLPKDLSPGDSVELYGEEGCGKTELLIHFCVSCILPKTWFSIDICGKETKVIFIDTSYKFPLWRLIQVMEQHIRKKTKAVKDFISTHDMDKMIKSCLQRLYIVQCSSSLNLMKTLSFLERLLVEDLDISIMMIDSISEFYWTDKTICGIGRYEQETNQRSIISKLKWHQEKHGLLMIVVKSAIMNKKFQMVPNSSTRKSESFFRNPEDYLSPEWNKFLTYKYEIIRKTGLVGASDVASFHAFLKGQEKAVEHKFIITDSGIEFLPD